MAYNYFSKNNWAAPGGPVGKVEKSSVNYTENFQSNVHTVWH